MEYTENYKITSHDVDVNNNIKPSFVLRYMQETANHQMRDRKPSYYDLFFDGKSFVITRIAIEIYEQIHQYDEVVVKTWRCPEKVATFIRCYSIEREGKTIAKAYSEWAVANRNTGKLCKASEIDISNYDTGEPVTLKIPTRFRFPKDLKFQKVGTHHVYYSDVDMNKHMNNTNYPDMLWNLIPNIMEKQVDFMSIRFMKEAPLDGDIDIYMAEQNGAYCFKTKVEDGTNVEAVIGTSKIKPLL